MSEQVDGGAPLPPRHTARDIDFHEHDYVSVACVHRRHDVCDEGCSFCGSTCLCVCHRWRIAVHGQQ